MALQDLVTRGELFLSPLSNLPVTPEETKWVRRRDNSKHSFQTFITCEHFSISRSLPPGFWEYSPSVVPCNTILKEMLNRALSVSRAAGFYPQTSAHVPVVINQDHNPALSLGDLVQSSDIW